MTLPIRSIGEAFPTIRAVPVTATAVAACLVVTVATPQAASAAPADAAAPLDTVALDRRGARSQLDLQDYAVVPGIPIRVARDAFTVDTPARGPWWTGASGPISGSHTAVRPVSGVVPTAGGFGARQVRGCGACSTDHRGLDFAAPSGTPVVATAAARVVSAGVFGGYGNQILLQHPDGTRTRYGHLSRIGVRVGQVVEAGVRIGAVGNTGVSTGAHLHFEVIVGGRQVDPARWLAARGAL